MYPLHQASTYQISMLALYFQYFHVFTNALKLYTYMQSILEICKPLTEPRASSKYNVLSCKDGLTAFHEAARGGHIPVAQFLLERGANAEAKTNVRYHI